MNRVKKVSRQYASHRPAMDEMRRRRKINRRARRMDKLQSVLVEGFNAMTKKELMALAQEENIRGRSRMTKDELIQALLYANAA